MTGRHRKATQRLLTVLFCVGVFYTPMPAAAQDAAPDNPIPERETQNPIPLEVTLGSGVTQVNGLTEYLVAIYSFAVGAVGILATVMIMFHGFGWAIAGGNAEDISKAKSGIINAIIGLVLAYTSYTLLYIVNPETVNFAGIRVPMVNLFTDAVESEFAGGVGTYVMATCSVDNQNVTGSFPNNVGPCSQYSFPGGSMSAQDVANAINRYRGSVSGVFMTAIMKTESAAKCTNARSTYYSKRSGGDYIKSSSGVWTAVAQGTGTHKIGHACGLTQFIPSTARTYAPPCGLSLPADNNPNFWSSADDEACQIIMNNPEKAICMMAKYFGTLSSSNYGHEVFMAAGYNGGDGSNAEDKTECPGGHTKWQCEKRVAYRETRNYIGKTDASKKRYCEFYGGTVTGQVDGSGLPKPPTSSSSTAPTS